MISLGLPCTTDVAIVTSREFSRVRYSSIYALADYRHLIIYLLHLFFNFSGPLFRLSCAGCFGSRKLNDSILNFLLPSHVKWQDVNGRHHSVNLISTLPFPVS